ncbi:hypothetical protein [Candidatus Burkholderia verschuerenii]|uniref:hypothetical protein n=1 Tax=Candidatus Burkholderia verschuerenii TaxID=242163 RepID=UPI0012ECE45B|nr:hypothetical protein [Candidatus Burkholderia verschuerenii]
MSRLPANPSHDGSEGMGLLSRGFSARIVMSDVDWSSRWYDASSGEVHAQS